MLAAVVILFAVTPAPFGSGFVVMVAGGGGGRGVFSDVKGDDEGSGSGLDRAFVPL